MTKYLLIGGAALAGFLVLRNSSGSADLLSRIPGVPGVMAAIEPDAPLARPTAFPITPLTARAVNLSGRANAPGGQAGWRRIERTPLPRAAQAPDIF